MPDFSSDFGGNPDSPDLTSSTGQNDSSSPWGGGLLKTAEDLAGKGIGLYTTVTAKPTTKTQAPVTALPAAQPSGLQAYLPWAIGGVVLLVIVGMFARK